MSLQPKRTMQIAQRLYEAGHITYMRTDSATLSEEARLAAESWVRTTFGEEYVAGTPVKSKGKSTQDGKAQEAHEAIRPTHMERVELPAGEDWSAPDRKLYKLIWGRAVQSVMAAAKGEQRTVKFTATADPMEFLWVATWKRNLFLGWRKIGAVATNLDEEADADESMNAWNAGEKIVEGTELAWSSLEAGPHETKPLARYTEATLVRELERKGIGRPSTYASLVATVVDKGYAEKRDTPARESSLTKLCIDAPGTWPPKKVVLIKMVGAEKQKLAPTALGLSVLEFCLKEFGTLFDYEFTKKMEARLDAVAEGDEPWKGLCRDTWDSYRDRYTALKSGTSTTTPVTRERHFPGGIKAIQSKKGPLLLKENTANKDETIFYGWPENIAFQDITETDVAAYVASKAEIPSYGTYEGHPMIQKSGPFGTYIVCNGVNVPWTPADTEETIVSKLAAKSQAYIHTLGPFEFRNGPYGIFMFKKDVVGKFRKFVSIPQGVDPKGLTQEAATKIYQTGLQRKAQGQAFKKKVGP